MDVSSLLQSIEPAQLEAIVRQLLQRDAFRIQDWRVDQLGDGAGNPYPGNGSHAKCGYCGSSTSARPSGRSAVGEKIILLMKMGRRQFCAYRVII